MPTSPPRLLAGAALIFWGGLTGHTFLGLLAAVALEANSWVALRWEFKRESYIKAWQFSILCGAFIAILAWVNGMKVGKIHTLFVWAPLILLPLELAQRYGNAKSIPLNTFSFFARRKMQHDLDKGRSIAPRMINTGYPYIAIIILATAMASRNELYHFIGLTIIIGACLYAYVRKSGFRPWAWGISFLLVMVFAYAGQWGMFKLYNYYTGGEEGGAGHRTSANESRTSIGRLGRIKLSPRIFWRMQVTDGNVPKLLRTATYNQYSRTRWTHEFNPSKEDDYDEFGYARPNTRTKTLEDDRDIRWFTKDDPGLTPTAPITLIGEVDSKVEENPIPLPHFFLAVGDLDPEADIETNSLGTVRMANPNFNVVEYGVWTGDRSTTEMAPIEEYDLSIPAQELEAIRQVCDDLGLRDENLSTRAKILKLRHFFLTEFQYSTHLTAPKIEQGKRQSAVGIFLQNTRSGHCEYFATATALLLREANIPARYCVGFSVNEKDTDRDEWVMRGLHAHAWCRVWIEEPNDQGILEGHWEDVDLTPPEWTQLEAKKGSVWKQKLADWWQRLREDFLIWRTREANKTMVYVIVSVVVSLLILWVGFRLWQSRQRSVRKKHPRYQRPVNSPTTPLHRLESLASKKIGKRPEGMPLGEWLHQLNVLDLSTDQLLTKKLTTAIEIHSIIRFDPDGARPEQHRQLNELCVDLKKEIKKLTTSSESS